MTDCTIHLVTLHADASLSKFINQVAATSTLLVKGKPHGWVQKPRILNSKQLTDHNWDVFLLTERSTATLPDSTKQVISTHISVPVQIPEEHFTNLKARLGSRPVVAPDTPALPTEWFHSSIPQTAIVETKNGPLESGELRLDAPMTDFLSTAFPKTVADEPACFFNFFKYANGDRSIHDAYMQGFKDNFGSAAGASVLFMGPVKEALRHEGADHENMNSGTGEQWDDANLVQYDSVWHYAYMLSTDVYKGLNKQKVQGLEDTCILLISEIELFEET